MKTELTLDHTRGYIWNTLQPLSKGNNVLQFKVEAQNKVDLTTWHNTTLLIWKLEITLWKLKITQMISM